jgi:putative hydrolase
VTTTRDRVVDSVGRGGVGISPAYHALVSDPVPADEPFQGMPFLGDLARLLKGQGAMNWDAARQFALLLAGEGTTGANVEPTVRFRWQELARIAELHVQHHSGLSVSAGGRTVQIVPVTHVVWAQAALDAYRPLFDEMANALGQPPPSADVDDADPAAAMMAGFMQLLSPTMLGMSAGSLIGHLAKRSLGQYDLPVPRPPSAEIYVVDANVTRFANDWSLPVDDVRLWVCLAELTQHAVFTVPHVRSALTTRLAAYVAGFRPNPDALGDRLASFDLSGGDAAGLQQIFNDPQVLLGAMASPEQLAVVPKLDALVAVVIGYVDHVVDQAAPGLLGSASRIAEAARRRRVDTDRSDVFVERLLGLSLSRQQVERGTAFVTGVIERAGDDGLAKLWRDPEALPTPAEVDAPGLWLARLEFDQG